MARANRHYLPGHVWHITHRCHKREFLFKFSKDRQNWLQWLFEARRRYSLLILNFVVTPYIDLNMVRAGVVKHPSEWPFGGYQEIQEPRRKCRLIAHDHLLDLLGIATHEQLKVAHAHWIEEMLKQDRLSREDKWSSSIGVGSEEFMQKVRNDLGIRAQGRTVVGEAGDFELRESVTPYIAPFGAEKEDIGLDNAIFWNI